MAGHSQFKNIMHRKGAQDAKRAKQFTKLVREIVVAVKSGGPDPEFNAKLRTAISTAKAANLPKDRIENAIKKGSSAGDTENFEEIRYECYASGGVALIIDALTDNRNRTSSDIKAILNKYGATMAEPGSVLYMFDRVGFLEFHDEKLTSEQVFEIAIEAGAEDCESDSGIHSIYCKPDDFNDVKEFLCKKLGDPTEAKLFWKPKNVIYIKDAEQAEKLMKFIDLLEDNDDVQYVCGNYVISNF